MTKDGYDEGQKAAIVKARLLAAKTAAESFIEAADSALEILQTEQKRCVHEDKIEIATAEGPRKFFCRNCKRTFTDEETGRP
jgi:hypothetical protein